MEEMYRYKAKVTRIVDGDTLDVIIDLGFSISIKERLRLYGVNTPETRTRDKEEKKKGLAAKEFVRERVEDSEVQIQTYKKGKFGRALCVIYYNNALKDDINLNQELINEGHAVSYYGGRR